MLIMASLFEMLFLFAESPRSSSSLCPGSAHRKATARECFDARRVMVPCLAKVGASSGCSPARARSARSVDNDLSVSCSAKKFVRGYRVGFTAVALFSPYFALWDASNERPQSVTRRADPTHDSVAFDILANTSC